MTLLLILLGVFVLGCLLFKIGNYELEVLGLLVAVIGGLGLFFSLLLIPIHRLEVRGGIQEFYAIADTARNAREAGDGMESAAYRLKIAEANQWLAKSQYWAGTTFWIYFPDAIKELEPIE